ncbi:MAG TPA: AAA family ATPase [Terracidiphilus sp.]|nr:AAA family ATPase [Terracidiphilus sp.]
MDIFDSSDQAGTQAQEAKYSVRSDRAVTTDSSPYFGSQYPESIGAAALSIALIGPSEERRAAAVAALTGSTGNELREFPTYPPSPEEVNRLLEQQYDIVVIDLDADPEYALELVENISASGAITVMVYSEKSDPDVLMRCMRAGAREFLILPFDPNVVAEALVRAAARRPVNKVSKRAAGRLLTFIGAKGGAGATTIACNFAVALAQDPNQKTLLIDLDLPLGDGALNLGIAAEYSTINALQSTDRLDASFLSQLIVKHSSGLSVLAAPGKFIPYEASDEAVDRLLEVARQDFDNVVVDWGSRVDFTGTSVLRESTAIYLVTQAGIPELRNSNRLISQFFTGSGPKLEIVINRYEPRSMGVGDEHITKALTRPAQWKIPNDYPAVRKMQINASPLVLGDTPIARLIKQMARAATGQTDTPVTAKKKGFSLFG